MKIRLLKPYNMLAKGTVVDFGAGVAELLIIRKIAEPVEKKKTARKPEPEK